MDKQEIIRRMPSSELIRGLRGLAEDYRVSNRGEMDIVAAILLEEAAWRLENNGRL